MKTRFTLLDLFTPLLPRRIKRAGLLAALMLLGSVGAVAQLTISSVDTPFIIDFDNSVTNVNSGSHAQGFLNFQNFGPINGYASTTALSTTGWSDGDMNFNDASAVSGDKWRGVTNATTAQSSGGCWGITLSTGNKGLGVQPGGSDFTPGSIALKMSNTSGTDFDSITVSYDLYVRNDADRSSSFDLQHSSNNSSYTAVPALQYTSTEASAGNTLISQTMSETFAVTWVSGTDYYIRWYGDDVGGSGSRDEFFIDNISVTGRVHSAPSNTVSTTVTSDSLFCVSSTLGDSVAVTYLATGNFNLGNTYNVELSDAVGDFASPTIIGSLNDTDTVGNIACFIPAGTTAGTGYRIRVSASDPATVGSDNGTDLIIGGFPSLSASVSDVSCNAANDGAIDLTVSGGTAPYVFTWSNSAITEDLTGLAAGTYTVTVTDIIGCVAFDTSTVSEPLALSGTGTVSTVSCNGGTDGGIDLTVTGGTSGYSYLWSNAQTTEDLSSLGAGVYSVTITDANSCTDSSAFTVSEPALLSVSASGTDISCNGSTDGAIDATGMGGTFPYSYLWSNGATSEDLSSLSSGTYTVTLTDDKGCTATGSAFITEPSALSASAVAADASCNGLTDGSIDLTVSGASSPYTFLWTNAETTEDLSGLSAGAYSVTVTDANGCTATSSGVVAEPTAISVSSSISSASCGVSDGEIDLTVSGGSSPYTFLWSNAETTEDITSLSSGTYTVTVTENTGCTKVESFNVSSTSAVTASAIVSDVNCNGETNGGIDVTGSGGALPYTFLWSNGASSEDLNTLAAGTYTLTITDAVSCQYINSYVVAEPNALAANLSPSDVTCNGANDGSIDLTVSGGTSPYTFSWSNTAATEDISGLSEGTFTVTVTDDHGCVLSDTADVAEPDTISVSEIITNASCNGLSDGSIDLTLAGGTAPYGFAWSTSATTEDLGTLSSGTYTVTVTDANSCTKAASFTVAEPNALALSAVSTNVSCNGGSDGELDLTASGGTSPYTYSWSTGATTEDLTALVAGSYTVTLTDDNSCTATETFTISEPTQLAIADTITDVTCNAGSDGAINIGVSGGTSAYSFAWSNASVSEDLTGLAAGSYTVTVTDNNGCTETGSYTVSEPTAIALGNTVNTVTCNGGSDGSIDLTVSGGAGNYTFDWSNAMATEDISGLSAGTYTVTVSDNVLCTQTAAIVVGEPAVLSIASIVDSVSCNGLDDGAIDLTVSGGTPSYSFLWSNASTNEDLASLAPGTYTVTVTDGASCTLTGSYVITEPTLLTVSSTATAITCNGSNDGAIDMTISGGTAGYSFVWNTAATTEDLSGLAAGTYTITVVDANLCSATASATIAEPAPIAQTAVIVDANCNGSADGEIDLTVTGGTSPFGFNWSNGPSTEDLSGLAVGSYFVTITDANGCTLLDDFTVAEPDSILATAVLSNASCAGDANGAIDLTVTGGTGTLDYLWSGAQTTEDVSNLASGTYSVTITDANLCSTSLSYFINEPTALSLSSTVADVTCNAGNDGTIDITVAGGTNPFSYVWSSSETTEDVSALSAGTYSVTVVDDNGCVASLEAIAVAEPAALSIDFTVTDLTDAAPSGGEVDAEVSGGTEPYTYAWSNAATTEDLTGLSEAGFYTLTVTDANGCEWIDSAEVKSTVGIQSLTAGSTLRVFPNPTSGRFTFDFSQMNGSMTTATMEVTVYDITGKAVASNFIQPSTNNTITLDASAWDSGMYFYHISVNEKMLTSGRIIRQ